MKEALPGVLSSARGFVEGELLPEAANMQAAYDKMQAERRAEAERQAAAMALWEAAGKRRAVCIHPTVVRAGYSVTESDVLPPLAPGERLAILEERPVEGSDAPATEAEGDEQPKPEPEPEPEGGGGSAPQGRSRISFRMLGSDDTSIGGGIASLL